MTADLTPDERHFADADAEPRSIAAWLHDHGVSVFPTVNKVPAVPKGTSWCGYRCTREQAAGFREYGVSLIGLLVVDADTLAAREWMSTHLPYTPFRVTTGRFHDGSPGNGEHQIFRSVIPMPKFILREGLTIESKNDKQYVVGAGSVRPDGVVYRPSTWSWRWEEIPFFPVDFLFDDGSCGQRAGEPGEAFEFPDVVAAGERHYQLFKLIRSWKWFADIDQTRECIHLANVNQCRPPLIEDDEFERWFVRCWNKPDRPFADAPVLGGYDPRTLRRLGLRL